MRESVLNYIKTLPLGTFTVSDDLPRDESGITLYSKNPKRIYVDLEQYTETPLVQALNGFDLHAEDTTVSVYFTADAKQLPANYSSIVTGIKAARNIDPTEGFNNRTVDISTNYEADMLLTRVDITYRRLTS